MQCRSKSSTIALAMAAAIINNVFRKDLQGTLDSATIEAIVQDPTGIWQHRSDQAVDLTTLTPEQKAAVITGFVMGFNRVFQVLIGFVAFDFVVALLFIKRHSLTRDDEAQMKERGKELMEHRAAKKREKHEHDLEKAAASAPPSIPPSRRQSHDVSLTAPARSPS